MTDNGPDIGAESVTEPLTDEEAMEVRNRFGYLLRPANTRSRGYSTLHIPEEDGSEYPLCSEDMGYRDDRFDKKTDSQIPHGYVKESSYGYCKHCARIWRQNG